MTSYDTEPERTRYNRAGCCLVGDDIIVPDGYRFPNLCLVTGRPVQGKPREQVLHFKPEGGLHGVNLSLAGFFARQFFGEKKRVWYYLERAVERRRKRLGIGAVVSFCSIMVGPIVFLDSWLSVASFLFCAILGFTLLFLRKPRFSLHSKMIRVSGANAAVVRGIYEAE